MQTIKITQEDINEALREEAEFLKNCFKWNEINREKFDQAESILPPIYHAKGFFVGELSGYECGQYYQEQGGKYYTSLLKLDTSAQQIKESLEAFIKEQGQGA